jgi:hypothetical protein
MTPRERVERVLSGRRADKVPFTVYECMIPQCAAERELRNRGLCIVKRQGVFATHRPNVKTTQLTYWQDRRKFVRTVHETPAGTLTGLGEDADFTTWQREFFFKGPQDYKAILFFLQDEQYEPAYEDFARAQEAFGPDAIFRAAIGLEPLQALISGGIFSPEDFCLEWMDRRDEVLKLYRAIVENRRRIYPIVAGSPAGHANYGGNVVPEIIGLEVFRKFYVPHYDEAAEVMHARGKLIGCHFDANCRLLAADIAATGLDYVEAFTPGPPTDMTLADARRAWPKKILWLNFPSALHLKPDAQVTAATLAMLDSLPSPDGVIMGITEDMPPDRWQSSCRAIMDGLDQHANLRAELYSAQ